jgi:hypothetical protein
MSFKRLRDYKERLGPFGNGDPGLPEVADARKRLAAL